MTWGFAFSLFCSSCAAVSLQDSSLALLSQLRYTETFLAPAPFTPVSPFSVFQHLKDHNHALYSSTTTKISTSVIPAPTDAHNQRVLRGEGGDWEQKRGLEIKRRGDREEFENRDSVRDGDRQPTTKSVFLHQAGLMYHLFKTQEIT